MADSLFDDYFSVHLACDVHLDWLADDPLPDAEALAGEQPALKRQLDALAEQEQLLWAEVKDDRQGPLARLIELFGQKLTLVADQVLSDQLGATDWHQTVHFSAGGFSVAKALCQGNQCKVSLRLPVGMVQGYARLDAQDQELAYFHFVSLLEPDRERLVRLALQTQSDQLRARRERLEEKS